MTSFQRWLNTFIEEKGIDLGQFTTDKNGHPIQYGLIISTMMTAPEHEQKQIQNTFVKIDFINGNPNHFICHLAKALDAESVMSQYCY